MRRKDYTARTDVEFGANKGLTFTKDEAQELSNDMQHRHTRTQAAVTIDIETPRHSLTGVCESWGLNYPTFMFADGSRGFISTSEDADKVYLLFHKPYGDCGIDRRGYKYQVEECEISIHWHRTPSCPVCDSDMTYGHADWDPTEGRDGYMSGWLCDDCLGFGVTEGVR